MNFHSAKKFITKHLSTSRKIQVSEKNGQLLEFFLTAQLVWGHAATCTVVSETWHLGNMKKWTAPECVFTIKTSYKSDTLPLNGYFVGISI